MTTELDNEEIIRQVIGDLEKRFEDRSPAELEAVVREEFDVLSGRPVRDYLLILTERAAKKRLKGPGKTRATSPQDSYTNGETATPPSNVGN